MSSKSSGSSLGGGGGSGNTASTISTSKGSNTASSVGGTGGSKGNTASTIGGSRGGNVFSGAGAGLGASIQVSEPKPIGALGADGEKAPDIFDTEGTIESLQDEYATLLEQKMYAEVLRNLVGRESKEFQDWAKGKGISITQHKDIQDFINNIEAGLYTTDSKMNQKIDKLIKYIPDIVGSLAKNQVIAPASKIIEGKNPVVDEVKFAIEKVISPTLKKVGALLEKRFGSEVGKAIGKSLTAWGERLATLPSKVLERIGLPDIVLSVVDAGLLAIDKGTGNYRQQNHDFPPEVLGIPIVGQTIEILSSVRDLLDTAVGIPRDDEAIPKLQKDLETNLWRPAIQEYNDVMKEFASKEGDFKKLADAVNKQSLRSVVFEDVVPRLDEIASEFGNNQKDMKDFLINELGIDFKPDIPSASKATSTLNTLNNQLTKELKDLAGINAQLDGMPSGRGRSIFEASKKSKQKKITELKSKVKSAEQTLQSAILNDNQRFLAKDINAMIDFQLGKKSRADLEKELTDTAVKVPKIKQVINGAEVRARVALDNVYTNQSLLTAIDNGVKSIGDQINDLNARKSLLGNVLTSSAARGNAKAKAYKQIRKIDEQISQLRKQQTDLQAKKPEVAQQLQDIFEDLEESIQQAEDLGLDMSFMENSKNWDKALADMEDDTMFWESSLPGGLFF